MYVKLHKFVRVIKNLHTTNARTAKECNDRPLNLKQHIQKDLTHVSIYGAMILVPLVSIGGELDEQGE